MLKRYVTHVYNIVWMNQRDNLHLPTSFYYHNERSEVRKPLNEAIKWAEEWNKAEIESASFEVILVNDVTE